MTTIGDIVNSESFKEEVVLKILKCSETTTVYSKDKEYVGKLTEINALFLSEEIIKLVNKYI